MRRRRLGSTGLEVSELGFGCSGFWARPSFPATEAVTLLERAIDAGITFLDTGPSYGAGEGERRLGRVLRTRRRDDLVVATKGGTLIGRFGRPYLDFTPATVRQNVEGSLRRLGVNEITLLQLHGPQAADITDDLLDCLTDLQTSGTVRFVGVNGWGADLLDKVLSIDLFETMMFDYNYLAAGRAREIDRVVRTGRAVIAGTPLGQRHFRTMASLPRRRADLWYLGRAVTNNRDAIRRGRSFRFLDRYDGWTGPEIALAYVLENPDVSTAVFGTTSGAHLSANVAVSGRSLPAEIVARIDAV